jgi:hypothetical protein
LSGAYTAFFKEKEYKITNSKLQIQWILMSVKNTVNKRIFKADKYHTFIFSFYTSFLLLLPQFTTNLVAKHHKFLAECGGSYLSSQLLQRQK